jgi:hypothetical protein
MGFVYNQIENLRHIAEDKDLDMYNTKLLSKILNEAADTIEKLYCKLKVAESKETKTVEIWNGEWKSPKMHPRIYEKVLIRYEYPVCSYGIKRTEKTYGFGFTSPSGWHGESWDYEREKEYKIIAWMYLPEAPDKIISYGDEND